MPFVIHCPTCKHNRETQYRSTVYCSVECYVNRWTDNDVVRLVRSFGGHDHLAKKLGLTPKSVRQWYIQGIPYRHYDAILKLATRQRMARLNYRRLATISDEVRAAFNARKRRRTKGVDKRRVKADRVEVQDGKYVVIKRRKNVA